MLLGTWRTNDAEKNHTHKIRKRKKEKKRKKKKPPHDGWDGTWKMAWAFCVGRNRNRNRGRERKYTKEGRNYDTIRGGRRRSRSGTSEHIQPYLTLPYLNFYICVFYRLSAGYVPVVVRDFTWTACTAPQEPFLPPA